MNNINYNLKPKLDNFYMPSEWQYHQGCLLIWPYSSLEWRDNGLPAQKAFIALTNELIKYENVKVIVDPSQYQIEKQQLNKAITLIEIKNSVSWARDHGPTYVINDFTKEIRGINWLFNFWGVLTILEPKYYYYVVAESSLANKILSLENKITYWAPLVLEGGAFHVDGEGTCITTEQCLLNANRNPNLTKSDIEIYLKAYLNVKKIIWLKYGADGKDVTAGHVDGVLSYIAPVKVLFAWKENPSKKMIKNLKILEECTDAVNRKLEIIKINCPKPLILTQQEYDTFSKDMIEYMNYKPNSIISLDYVNIYIGNGVVLVPQYGHDLAADCLAINVIKKAFPNHDVLGINSKEFSLSGGNIHCMTQQIPGFK